MMTAEPLSRIRIHIEGVVQGVGFRPFVYREAQNCGLTGWVLNNSQGVQIEVEGTKTQRQNFITRLQTSLPPLAKITHFSAEPVPLQNAKTFIIRQSELVTDHNIQVAPDSAVCLDCLKELFDLCDRRNSYPFINCTNCGPRYSIVTAIPYDRANTTMAPFTMCPECQAEYDDPRSRRFHAQPNACDKCGPQLTLHDSSGQKERLDPLWTAIEALQRGEIIAIKGLAGYHLAVDATNDLAVAKLRRRKARDEKPFALMSIDLDRIRSYATLNAAEQELLESPQRPIVLLEKLSETPISKYVAPRNRYFGVMLPSTPLHYLLLLHFTALVMTSGNLSDEPIAFTDADANSRLSGIADLRLSYNRDIHIRCDDSIARIMAGKPMLLRRSRGYVPTSLALPQPQPRVLALGAELKNTFCLTRRDRAFLSQHIGDLKNAATYHSFTSGIEHLQQLLQWQPELIAHDLHPDYLSTSYAKERVDLPRIAVQHHHAHLASCMAENNVDEPCIGVIYDGIGYGSDGHIWGGEFLIGDYENFRRAGHFSYLAMPGGDRATKEPYRMALSLLHYAYGDQLPELEVLDEIPAQELKLLRQMIVKKINSPLTSSCGRLFDAVAALTGVRSRVHYEGQAALELEMAITQRSNTPYPYQLEKPGEEWLFDPATTVRAIVADIQSQVTTDEISARFHHTLAVMTVDTCTRLRNETGINTVALSGGVFQNRVLTETTIELLTNAGFTPLTHSLVPPNDGGLALGQAVIAGRLGWKN